MCFLTAYYERGSLDELHDKVDMTSKDRYGTYMCLVLVRVFLLTLTPNLSFMAIARDICNGLAHLHKDRIIHRDLACRNLLMDSKGTVSVG